MYYISAVWDRLVGFLVRSLVDQPIFGLLVLLAVIGILARIVKRSSPGSTRLLPMIGKVLGAAFGIILFALLIICFNAILSNSITAFYQSQTSQANANISLYRATWGDPIPQTELMVTPFIETTDRQIVANYVANNATVPTVYHDVTVRVPVPQNSITAVNALFTMSLNQDNASNAPSNAYNL